MLIITSFVYVIFFFRISLSIIFKSLMERDLYFFNRLSNVLTECGVKQFDCVVVILPRIPEWWLVNIACLKIGKSMYNYNETL